MLPKNKRLNGRRIEHLFKKGRISGNTFLTVKYSQNRQNTSRFCIIVSTKLFAKAVERNHLRRQIYETLRLHPKLPITPCDMVFIIKVPMTKLKFKELQHTIINTLKYIKS